MKNRDKRLEYSRRWSRTLKGRYHSHVKGARERGLITELSLERYSEIIQTECCYCGLVPYEGNWNGVDRKNSNLGYIEGNCVPCCRVCNYTKGSRIYEDWVEWIMRIRSCHTEI